MTDKQPEALWLADAMDCVTDDACGYCMPCRIAAELRRLSAVEAERDALRVVQPSAFDPVAAMRLADNYAFAQSELDGEHSTSRKYYVDSRDEARAALAAYLGIKEAK